LLLLLLLLLLFLSLCARTARVREISSVLVVHLLKFYFIRVSFALTDVFSLSVSLSLSARARALSSI